MSEFKKHKYQKAWMWWCPVWFKKGNPPVIMSRHWSVDWLLWFTIFMHNSMICLAAIVGIDIEEGYPIKIKK
jgi:hypothetical protein